jgi:hypothetical protein
MGRGLVRSLFTLVWEALYHPLWKCTVRGYFWSEWKFHSSGIPERAKLEAPERGFRIPGSREGSYTRVSKWKSFVWLSEPRILCVWRTMDFSRQMYRILWVKCTPLQRFQNYSNSRVHGHGQLASCTWLLSRMIITYGELGEWHDLTWHWFGHTWSSPLDWT